MRRNKCKNKRTAACALFFAAIVCLCATKELRIKPFRAYMSGPAYTEAFGNGAQQAIAIHLDGTTSLDVLRDEAGKVSLIYDITGRQVSEGKSGIYVIDGKKYYKK